MFLSSAIAEKGNKKNNLHEVLTRFLPVSTNTITLSNKTSPNRVMTSDHLAKVNLLH